MSYRRYRLINTHLSTLHINCPRDVPEMFLCVCVIMAFIYVYTLIQNNEKNPCLYNTNIN